MISKKLILFKQYFLYEGKKYTIDEFFNNINEIYKNLEIIIAEDEIFISQYKLKDNNVTLFLDNIMLNNQINNENILKIILYRKPKVLIITKIDKNIYAIVCEKGCITYSNIIINDKDVLNNEILKFSKDIEIILDKEVEDFLVDEIKKCYKIKIKSIGRNISEKIYKV